MDAPSLISAAASPPGAIKGGGGVSVRLYARGVCQRTSATTQKDTLKVKVKSLTRKGP